MSFRCLAIFAVVGIILSGCSSRNNEENNMVTQRQGRQAITVSHEPIGLYDEGSVFGHTIFKAEPESADLVPPYLSQIYREITPWTDGDALEALTNSITGSSGGYSTEIGDAVVGFLLTEESVTLSDSELFEKLSSVTQAYVFSKTVDSVSYRLVAVKATNTEVYYSDWMAWCYYVQVWDDDTIRAQPLCEWTEFEFGQAAFVTDRQGSEIVILGGQAERPVGSSFATAAVGFSFNGVLWSPVNWDLLYDEIGHEGDVEVRSDGVIMTYYDPQFANSLYLPQHSGALYSLELSEDGSVWANYALYSDYPANEKMPKKSLLFQLK